MPWKSVAFWQDRWPGYVVAILLVATAAALRDVIAGIIGARGPFLLFFSAILAAAGVGGLGPAILAVTLSAALGWIFADTTGSEAMVHLAIFLVSGFGVVGLAALLSRWRTLAADSERAIAMKDREAGRLTRELELLIDGATNYAIYMLDPAGRVTIWNEGAQRIKGWTEAEILGRHCSAFYPADEAEAGKPQAASRS